VTKPVGRWIRRLTFAGLLLCFGVVVLGAYVRLTAAGLGCPDWPGCYGQATPLGAAQSAAAQAAFPNRPLDVGKAWREMIHRYAASTLGLIIVSIAALVIAQRNRVGAPTGITAGSGARAGPGNLAGTGVGATTRGPGIPYALVLLATVVFQGVLGMLTVTWQLKPLIVTSHLVFGLTTLGLLWWLWLSLRAPTGWSGSVAGAATNAVGTLALVGLIALGVQIVLGGWTSSNYAAIACPDFPRCQNQWWPATDYGDAFVLWRGLGINYEGGILDNPARVAIHLTHRLGALVASITLALAALMALLRPASKRVRRCAGWVLAALVLQLTIGISMVVRGFPLWLATAHTAGAALLLLTVLALLRAVRPQAGVA